ncbi:lysosomal alpha-mannosidase [Klebsormidium nitens]|uniref:Lysosomal alpha-mannosidase n=1 Tax=Klebsormidium nitens TaxID=105231 RepID=A0A1Y1IH31_KLENI|nr:lysosomal alpha-mannosidase [Klebsormidium nitens]|eukprot:GAQ90184.1 lysosomal alpha-mannosidase [Klebsormidium nitens]
MNSSNGYPRISVVRGPLFEEVRQELSSWASIVIRVPSDGQDAQLRYTVGPIPSDISGGQEVVLRLEADVRNGGTFYTDSNGRDLIKRVVNYRPSWDLIVTDPVAGNYYPVNAAILIRDSEKQLTVLTDRSLGGTSLREGHIDLMLHRRLVVDDGRGVDEALNEQQFGQGMVTRGTFRLGVHDVNVAASWLRGAALRHYQPLELAFATQIGGRSAWLKSRRGGASGLPNGAQLPPNVALVTLQQLASGAVLLRLGHLFEVDEDPVLSRLANVDLRTLFAKKIKAVTEMTLSGNQARSNVQKLVWRVENEPFSEAPKLRGSPFGRGSFLVELGPMEIRTFEIIFGNDGPSVHLSWGLYAGFGIVLLVGGLIMHAAYSWWRGRHKRLPGYHTLSQQSRAADADDRRVGTEAEMIEVDSRSP